MFKYVLFIVCVVTSLWGVASVTPPPDDLVSTGGPAEDVLEGNSKDSAEEEDIDNDEPSLEEPTSAVSNTFDAGTPPVTEESLEEEDDADSDQPA